MFARWELLELALALSTGVRTYAGEAHYILHQIYGKVLPMAKIKVLRVQSTMTEGDLEPLWHVVVDYGDGVEIQIPLRAHYLITDDALEQQRQSIEAMGNLARALLDFADRIRKRWPTDQA